MSAMSVRCSAAMTRSSLKPALLNSANRVTKLVDSAGREYIYTYTSVAGWTLSVSRARAAATLTLVERGCGGR